MTLMEKRVALVERRSASMAGAMAALYPSYAALLDGWEERTRVKSAAQDDALDYLDEAEDGDLGAEVEELLQDGYDLGYSETEAEGSSGSRLSDLLDQRAAVAEVAGAVLAERLSSVLIGRDPSSDALGQAVQDVATTTVSTEITAAVTFGTQDGCEAAGIVNVRIAVSGDECDFCQGYADRILGFDQDDGLPPLHRGCVCVAEPLID